MFLLNRRVMFAFASCVVISICIGFTSAFLSEELVIAKKMPEHMTGFVHAIPCLTYTISTMAISLIVGKYPRRLSIFVSLLMVVIAMLLQGPSELLGFPDANYIVLCGFALSGIA